MVHGVESRKAKELQVFEPASWPHTPGRWALTPELGSDVSRMLGLQFERPSVALLGKLREMDKLEAVIGNYPARGRDGGHTARKRSDSDRREQGVRGYREVE